VGLLWLQNVGWKTPPDFGRGDPPAGLYRFTGYAVSHEVFPPYAWLVDRVVLPNFTVFGWLVLLVEASLGAFLLIGLATRFWALVGIAQTVAITLSVLNAPNEWAWSYLLMLLAHAAVFATAAGRYFGLDGLLRPGCRQDTTTGKTTRQTAYAITSLTSARATGQDLARLIREHWSIEAHHHIRDVTFSEDHRDQPHRQRARQPGHDVLVGLRRAASATHEMGSQSAHGSMSAPPRGASATAGAGDGASGRGSWPGHTPTHATPVRRRRAASCPGPGGRRARRVATTTTPPAIPTVRAGAERPRAVRIR
jgi:thiosulfate dehydrogenase [quinone] large subunit